MIDPISLAAPRGVTSIKPVAAAEAAAKTAGAPLVKIGPWRVDSRYIAPALITVILLFAQLGFGVLESYDRTLLAIGTSIATEIALGLLLTRRIPHLASAYVSGISVGILVRSPFFWPFALCAAISIVSKYAIRWKGRHLWNPSNLGISVMLLLAPEFMATLSIQWDNRLWAMLVIWALGSYIIYNLKRFHICATYILSFISFAALRTLWTHDSFWAEVAPITGPMYQLFVFFMITDPKTTVKSKSGQIMVAFAVAAVECILRLRDNVHAPYFALFTVGPIANVLDIWLNERKLRRAQNQPQTSDSAPELQTATT